MSDNATGIKAMLVRFGRMTPDGTTTITYAMSCAKPANWRPWHKYTLPRRK